MDYYTTNSGSIYWDTSFVPGKPQVLEDEEAQTNKPQASKGTESRNQFMGNGCQYAISTQV